jgi:hypothetical protein
MIARVLGEQFGGRVGADSHPEHSVAIGAAWSTGLSVAPVTTAARAKVAAVDNARTVKAASSAAPVKSSSSAASAPAAGSVTPPEVADSGATAAAAPEFTATAAAAPEFTATAAAAPEFTATAAAAPEFTASGAVGAPAVASKPAGSASTVPQGAAQANIAPAAAAWGLQPVVRLDEFTDLQTPADPWAVAEAAEAAAADAEAAAATTTHIPTPRVPEEAAPDASTHLLSGGAYPSVPPLPAPAARRRRGIIVAAGTAVFVLAAASGVALSHLFDTQDEKKGGQAAGPSTAASAAVSASASASAAPSDTPPTATMLIRMDTGAFNTSAWKPTIQLFAPGVGSPKALPGTQPGDVLPRWSRDRKQIAVTKRNDIDNPDSNTIFVMNADGGNRRPLVDGVTAGRVAWSADGTKLAYVKRVGKVNQIFITKIDGSEEPEQVTRSTKAKDDPDWSPDGRSILYWAEGADGVKSIYALELDTATPEEPGRRITQAVDGDAGDPAISPDGKQVLFTGKGDSDANKSDIWIIPVEGGKATRITTDAGREIDPNWAPDSQWFAFTRGKWEDPRVVVIRKDGFGERVLTRGNIREGHPCWA